MIGARAGTGTRVRRLAARAAARNLTAFVVPGLEVARAHGLDPVAAGLRVVPTPRHANVLLLVGEIPPGLAPAAAVVYAQMPRPRAILVAGVDPVPPLPAPDVTVDLAQDDLVAGVARLRHMFATGSWVVDPIAFDVPAVRPQEDEQGGGRGHGAMDMGQGEHDGAGHEDMGGMDMPHDDHNNHGAMDLAHDDAGGMDMGMGSGFMSMVMMTRDLPRSPDGLPMEWLETPFGPLFPGLPGGLALTFTLDGDAVATAVVTPGGLARGVVPARPISVAALPARLGRLDPLAPVAYRLLALRALEDAAGVAVDAGTARKRVGALEWERAASHLGWLASFGSLLGDRWMADHAAALQRALLRAPDAATVARLQPAVTLFAGRVRHIPYLRRRLDGVGRPHTVHLTKESEPARFTAGALARATGHRGPVARAAGVAADARLDDPAYHALEFAPVVYRGDDAWARLRVRLAELARSLDLVLAAGSVALPSEPLMTGAGGAGVATVETPRGAATLRLAVDGGTVRAVVLDTPSAHQVGLVPSVAQGREVGDALVGVASLDLSPWEIDR